MDVTFQIFIPVLDKVNDVDITMNSIKKQNFPSKNIFVAIMDFGSTDGTYEKILSYDSYHLGVYRNTTTRNPRLMIAEMMRANNYTTQFARVFSSYFYYLVLYPGETIRKDCLQKFADIIISHPALRLHSLICESDIIGPGGHIIEQPLLFPEEKTLSGYSDYANYFCRGYQHQVLCLRNGIGAEYTRLVGGELNESRWWNKCHAGNYGGTNYYTPEKLANVKRINYADELEEILLRFESTIWQERIYTSFQGEKMDNEAVIGRKRNLAYYALWRSFLLKKQGKVKDAEDCWLMASIIDAEIETSQPYGELDSLLHGKNETSVDRLEAFFQQHGKV
ncbi:MAG: glycosyltransferase family 2 protein [Selenomonadaceae bacterium]|nr:glycosyltransferase family 2 protein [Selenomonadaceae bacterium]